MNALESTSNPYPFVPGKQRGRLQKHTTRVLSIFLALTLFCNSAPAAPQTIVELTTEWRASLNFWLRTSDISGRVFRSLTGQNPPRPKPQEKQQDRDVRIVRIQIYPGDVTVHVEEHVQMAAVAYDNDNAPVGGVQMTWGAHDEGRNRAIHLSERGEFHARIPGTFIITVEGGGRRAYTTVTVLVGPRAPRPTDQPLSVRQVSNRALPGTNQGLAGVNNSDGKTQTAGFREKRKGSRQKRAVSINDGDQTRRAEAFAHRRVAGAPAPMPQGGGSGGWNDNNAYASSDPGNGVGDLPGAPAAGGAGSGNFQFGAPILSSSGRGINVSLGAAYNGRLWNKAGSELTYDIDRGWPAPGWNLGFGKLVFMGPYSGDMLVEADGTRHNYAGVRYDYGNATTFYGHTTDGSFIDYNATSMVGGYFWATATMPDGTVINYNVTGPGVFYPTRVTDPNGNFVNITYVNNTGPRIQTITDTLGRVITFNYDSNSLLTAITAAGLGSGTTRTLVRFHYRHLNIAQYSNFGFGSVTTVVRDSNPWVIDAIYYPATATGYWFGDSASTGYYFGTIDSYSSYGLIKMVVETRNMTFSASSINDMGTITSPGQLTRKELYNYPMYPGDPNAPNSSNLTDSPTYSSMTQSWVSDGTGATDQAVTLYSVNENASPRTVEVTLPNGVKSKQYSYNYTSLPDNNPLKALDGLVYLDETRDSTGALLHSSSSSWEKGAYESPRPTQVQATNHEIQQATTATFTYGSYFNQLTDVRNYGYGGEQLRWTHTTYQNSVSYKGSYGSCSTYSCYGRHIFSLPLSLEVYDGSNNRVARTEYQYDGQTLTQRYPLAQHDLAFDPYANAEGYCYYDYDWSDPDCNGACTPELVGCDGYCPQTYYCPYDASTDYRGNVTQVTSYTNVDNSSATGALTETRRYDIAGNLVTASMSCCEQTSLTFTSSTQYAYPESQTRGSSDPNSLDRVTTSAVYDFNTGLVTSSTDANNRQTTTSYDAASLRPTSIIASTGAHTDYAYSDTAMTVGATTYLSSGVGGTVADQNVKLLNGRGQVRQEQARAPDNGQNQVWDCIDTTFDSLGLATKQTRPYQCGTTAPNPSLMTFDSLGRSKKIIAPDYTQSNGSDGSTTETFYNESTRPPGASSSAGETTRVRDAWGRERWGLTDAQGRLIQIAEPNPTGSGSVFDTGALLTNYSYDALGDLALITQGAQTRSFKYDSLGRITAQKLAETSATLNGSGVYVGVNGSGAQWSEYFRYENSRSNLVQRIDPRGVKTNFWYFNSAGHSDPGDGTASDPLNRLQSVSYDLSGSHENLSDSPILAAATISYQYRTKSSSSELKDVTQLASVVPGSGSSMSTESYTFDSEGRIDNKTLTFNNRTSYPFVTSYGYDTLGRVVNLTYPAEYGNSTQPRRVVHNDYDNASRVSGLSVDSTYHVTGIEYNAASQPTKLKIGPSGANQITENYSYDAQSGLLLGQTVVRGADVQSPAPTTLLNLQYDYANASGKRTGQLTKSLNNLNHNKDRVYSYDTLGRLTQATGGPSGSLWNQSYAYDRYGNRLSVTSSGYSAKAAGATRNEIASTGTAKAEASASLTKPDTPTVTLPTDQLAASTKVALPDELKRSGEVSDSPFSIFSSTSPKKSEATETNVAPPPQGGGTVNLALNKPATQSSTLSNAGVNFYASRAVDGNTDGAFWHLSTSATNFEYQPWWQVDLGSSQTIALIDVWARTDCCPEHTANIYVLVSDQPFSSTSLSTVLSQAGVSSYYISGNASTPSTVSVNRTGRYVRVQRTDSQYLVLAELKAWQSGSASIPRDGLATMSYDNATNRITSSGFSYDAAGNQTRVVHAEGSAQRFQYDAANRLVNVKADDNVTVICSYTYGASNQRLIAEQAGFRTYYSSAGGTVVAEYSEAVSSTTPQWSKSYVYLGARLLSTLEPRGGSWDAVHYYHPDRLGTRLITTASETNTAGTTVQEQVALPFGTALDSESSGAINHRFTSYDRSPTTGLDYASNRHYDSQQGRFTQVDPLGISSVSLASPQTLNLYAYCANDPINHTDPSGLGFFSFLSKVIKVVNTIIKWVKVALAVAIIALVIMYAPAFAGVVIAKMLAIAGLLLGSALGPKWLQTAINIGAAVFGIYSQKPGIIWNFSNSGEDRKGRGAGSVFLAVLGAINQFLISFKGSKGQLTRAQRAAYDFRKSLAQTYLNWEPCRDFLIRHGIVFDNVVTALEVQRPFNGLTSTINAVEAGLAPAGGAYKDLPALQMFADSGAGAMAAIHSGKTRFDVYLNVTKYDAPTLIHEALHSATGLNDNGLAKQLGVYDGNYLHSSSNITDALEANGCGGTFVGRR